MLELFPASALRCRTNLGNNALAVCDEYNDETARIDVHPARSKPFSRFAFLFLLMMQFMYKIKVAGHSCDFRTSGSNQQEFL